MPRRICDRITPELPRAPMSEPCEMALQTAARSGPAVLSSSCTDCRVSAMFVPVSPSGTGYTLRRLMPARWAANASA